MISNRKISVFEHQRLYVGEQGFKQSDLDSLLELHDKNGGLFFEPISKGVRFNQYVGVIQISGLILEINPKADKDDDNDLWKGVLLSMLKACGRLNVQSTGVANVDRSNLNLLEVYFQLYLKELEGLLRKGIVRQYRKESGNVKALKGKLEFAHNIRENIVRKDRFYTTHQVYDKEHLLHQVLYKALLVVDHFTKGTKINDLAKRVLIDFPIQKDVTISSSKLNTLKLNRKTASYAYAIDLAKLILLNYSPDIKSGNRKMLSLLFDMNQLWEEYVLKSLRKLSADNDFEVFGQDSKRFWGYNSLRPDIVIKKGEETYVIDTKWKRPLNSGVSVSDLRQMYTYCRFWNSEKAMLLYPGNFKSQEFKEFETDDYLNYKEGLNKVNHSCKVAFVSVLDKEGELDFKIGEKVMKELENSDII